MKHFHVVLLFICMLSIAAPPPSFAKKDISTYVIAEKTPGEVIYAISAPVGLSDNAALTITLSAYELAPCLASSTVAGSSGCTTKPVTVERQAKTTVAASSDSYCYKQVSNYSFNFKNPGLYDGGVSRKYHLHEDPGLTIKTPIISSSI